MDVRGIDISGMAHDTSNAVGKGLYQLILLQVLVWCMSWPLVRFFWWEIFIVADVAVSRVLRGAVFAIGTCLCQRVTLQTRRNCWVQCCSFFNM